MLKFDRDNIQELCRQWCVSNALEVSIENILVAADVLGFLKAAQHLRAVDALPEPEEMPTHYQDENGDWHDEFDDVRH